MSGIEFRLHADVTSGYFMFACLLVCGCLGAKAGHGEFETYLRAHPAFSKAVAA